jgi:uncharacterized membrane protein YgdD (TMEM256/DUF423 family)
MSSRCSLMWAALLGFLSVLIGAFGAHGLKAAMDAEHLGWVETGVRYQMYHSLALLFACSLGDAKWVKRARVFWVAGICIFSGSLYLLAFSAPRWLGMIAPLGGSSLMLGWLLIGMHSFSFGRKS